MGVGAPVVPVLGEVDGGVHDVEVESMARGCRPTRLRTAGRSGRSSSGWRPNLVELVLDEWLRKKIV